MPHPGLYGNCRGAGLGLSYEIVSVVSAKPEYSPGSETSTPKIKQRKSGHLELM